MMDLSLMFNSSTASSPTEILLMLLAGARILLETQKISWERLPLSGKIFGTGTTRFHRWGFYCACGYLLFALPIFFFNVVRS